MHATASLRLRNLFLLGVLVPVLAACTVQQRVARTEKEFEKGNVEKGFSDLRKLEEDYRLDPAGRTSVLHEQEEQLRRLIQEADRTFAEGRLDEAEKRYQAILAGNPYNKRARLSLNDVQRARRHAVWLTQAQAAFKDDQLDTAAQVTRRVLAENPYQAEALSLIDQIETLKENRSFEAMQAKGALQPVDLEFKNASLNMVLEALSKSSSLNFVLDRDVRPDLRTTLIVHQVPLMDALTLLLKTNQLDKKEVTPGTFIIYPNNPAKQKEYQELMVKTFYLGNASAKNTASLIKTLIKTTDVHVDENLNLIVLRDTPEALEAAARIIRSQDLAEPEVELQIEVLEITRDSLLQLGVQPPEVVSASVVGPAGTAGTFTLKQLEDLNSSNVNIITPTPAAILNLKRTKGHTQTLANPRIRVMNRENAKIHIGDKVPVITTNTNQTTGTTLSESVSYLDVGLKVEAEPQVFLDNEIAIKLNLEVNNVVKEVVSKTGLLTYQVGTRMASTTLRLKDGETQVIAGLIKSDRSKNVNGLPGLADIPLLGRFFSSHKDSASQSEIVLLITPTIIRNLEIPPSYDTAFFSGTNGGMSLAPTPRDPAGRRGAPERAAPDVPPREQVREQAP